MSKNKAVPTDPITGNGFSNHIPVINGTPKNIGKVMLKTAIERPIGISDNGFLCNNFIVSLVPCAKLCRINAIEATSPPTNPPPG